LAVDEAKDWISQDDTDGIITAITDQQISSSRKFELTGPAKLGL
jgi:hypothetical protein